MILWAEEMMKNDYGKVLMWLGVILILMAVDMITGFIQAYTNHDVKSGKMSTGILKKFALLVVLVAIVPLTIVLPDLISVSVIIGVYTLETLNELISVVENCNKLGVGKDIFNPIIKRLQAATKEEEAPDKDDQENNVR